MIDAQQALIAERDAAPGYPWANPDAPARISDLLAGFRARGLPVIHIHHHGRDPRDNFHPANPLSVMSRQVVAGNPRDWGFAFESEVGAMMVVVVQEWFEGFLSLI